MIIKMETVSSSHGHNAIAYAIDKGRNEKREPLPEFLHGNFVDGQSVIGSPDPTTVWMEMQLHQKNSRHNVKDGFIRLEICPPQEECQNWSESDWKKCLDDAIRLLDLTDHTTKNGKVNGRHTDLKNSQYVATIHRDTDNWHIHVVANRVTMDGKLQDANWCKERARAAADAFAQERGWVKAADRPNERIEKIHNDAIAVLRGMSSFSIEDYFAGLRAKGWEVDAKYDSKNICRGYSVGEDIMKPNGQLSSAIRIKASDLKHGKDLTVSRLAKTWAALHPVKKPTVQTPTVTPAAKVEKPGIRTEEPKRPAAAPAEVQKPKESTVAYQHEGKSFEIPKVIDDFIRENITLPKAEDYQNEWNGVPAMPKLDEVASTAAAIFAGYMDAATTVAPTSGGGGGGSSKGWRGKKDDDDRDRARNAAQTASAIHTPPHSKKIKRGFGR